MKTHRELKGAAIILGLILLSYFTSGCTAYAQETVPQARTDTIYRPCPQVWANPNVEPDRMILENRIETLQTVVVIASAHNADPMLVRTVVDAAQLHGLDPYMFARLIAAESSWRPHVVSHKDAIGLAQVKLSTARIYDAEITEDDLLDPTVSSNVGAWYLARLLERYEGNTFRALRAYNAGPTRIQTDSHVGKQYAARILHGD